MKTPIQIPGAFTIPLSVRDHMGSGAAIVDKQGAYIISEETVDAFQDEAIRFLAHAGNTFYAMSRALDEFPEDMDYGSSEDYRDACNKWWKEIASVAHAAAYQQEP